MDTGRTVKRLVKILDCGASGRECIFSFPDSTRFKCLKKSAIIFQIVVSILLMMVISIYA